MARITNPRQRGGASYNPGWWSFSVGGGYGSNSYSYGGGITYAGYGAGYYQTQYGDAVGPDGKPNPQTVGGVNLYWPGGSFRLENDFLSFKGEDRWRSNAFELTVGNYSIGSTIYNNDPAGEGSGAYPIGEQGAPWALSKSGKPNTGNNTAWKNGQTYSANLWGGYNFGNHVERFGFSNPLVQDKTQNWTHRSSFLGFTGIGHQHYYNKYDYFNNSPYIYGGYNNPYSLWGR